MTADRLVRLKANLTSELPLIGSLIRGRAVKGLFTEAEKGNADAVNYLCEAATASKYNDVRQDARRYLQGLTSHTSIDAFCQRWAETRD
ncbi:MAG TPA: hypothetical protein VK436_17105, partial [Methanocella sp.]|nr:hypothetical protein [Methanocella sp.]